MIRIRLIPIALLFASGFSVASDNTKVLVVSSELSSFVAEQNKHLKCDRKSEEDWICTYNDKRGNEVFFIKLPRFGKKKSEVGFGATKVSSGKFMLTSDNGKNYVRRIPENGEHQAVFCYSGMGFFFSDSQCE
jgi:hypothetical protein